jgi:hypothetical protein
MTGIAYLPPRKRQEMADGQHDHWQKKKKKRLGQWTVIRVTDSSKY